MLGSVRTLSDIAATKLTIEICHEPELKRDILGACGSHWGDQVFGELTQDVPELEREQQWLSPKEAKFFSKRVWEDIIEDKARVILRNMGLPEELKKKVMNTVSAIGLRMLIWAQHHEGIVGFSREYSVDFLKSSFFTQQGIIDSKKAAEELMKDKNLSVKQKYKIACLYCFEDPISDLYRKLTTPDETELRSMTSLGLIRFWSYYLIGKVDEITGDKTVDQFRLEKAVQSGSVAAVEYCLEKTDLKREKDAVIDAALEAVRNRNMLDIRGARIIDSRIIADDWIVFCTVRYDGSHGLWVPNSYYVDILYSLLSKMRRDQQIKFLKEDIEEGNHLYDLENLEEMRQCRVLECFLNWPYQHYFMKIAGLVWEFLPGSHYAHVLISISLMIEPYATLEYGGEQSNYYRGLFEEFWCQSPEHCKRYILNNATELDSMGEDVDLLRMLVTPPNFTYQDIDNIKLILSSVTDEARKDIASSYKWKDFCADIVSEKYWKPLDRFALICFSSQGEIDEFKRQLICARQVQSECIKLMEKDECDAVESLIEWSGLPEEEIIEIKREMIHSEDGMLACLSRMKRNNGVQDVDSFIRWYLFSEAEVNAFKKDLIFSGSAAFLCANLDREDKLDLVDKFIRLYMSSETDTSKFKRNIGCRNGSSVSKSLIISCSVQEQAIHGTMYPCKTKCEEFETIVTRFFSSEEEIHDFKKNTLFKKYGKEIHFMLIQSNLLDDAEKFFAWLGLYAEEVKELKKDTLFHHEPAGRMFSRLMHSKEGDEEFAHYGTKQDAIETLLRWYLTDKETVLEFKDKFQHQYFGEVTEEDRATLENFDLVIEQHLRDLDEEQPRDVKRQSETTSTCKKLCNL